ncbi:aminoglycoside phosphotransferase family protein [Bacillus sp. FJAT-49711]|uniref:aminoglycoside phosphotransferase family protein n=1 Tax=Bacillus sp. FJAT-49711 TaxID=2833585 RepID=UPI001BCA28F1|nr:aminoglycoside phosphotransferase family protein [Bacillus sp. FJAT-49711]MBS4220324.1 aminoglycoside phosphotransferase family protein [Bacillus sp. FJAT-49711]
MIQSHVSKAERITEDFLQERVIKSYQIIGKGSVNQVCVAETNNRKVVVRMNKADTYSSFVKESWCIEQARAVGIPSPQVLSIGIVDETAYMIQTFIDGENGLDSTKPKRDIWKQLGAYAKLIHTIPVKGYGENLISIHGMFQSPPHAGSDGSWLGYVNYNINSLTENDQLIELGVINQTESKKIRKLFEGLKEEKFHFALNHGDVSLKNTIVNNEGQVFLLDWGSAEVSVIPYGDIIEMLKCQILGREPNNEEFKAYLDGYGLMEKDLSSVRVLLLLRAFDKLRWAIDKSPDLIKPCAAFAKQVVDMALIR